jgi:Xaa-Pro aminopeptidase
MGNSAEANTIVQEKTEQAVGILQEKNIDLWLTFVRETSLSRDPIQPLLVGFDLTWMSALLIHRSGQRVAIVGRYDVENVKKLGAYHQVISYDQSINALLLEIIHDFNPHHIAVNYSESDPSADGLSYGMFRQLAHMLEETPYASRLCSAEHIIAALRGRKTTTEVNRIRDAIKRTEQALQGLSTVLQPGLTDMQIAAFLHQYVDENHLATAWERDGCPIVTVGPDSAFGHGMPTGLRTAKGHLIHVDFGVSQHGYTSDLQRTWYLLGKDEYQAPEEVERAWFAVTLALEAGCEVLKPGMRGWEVDTTARSMLITQGYPEFMHAFGHQIGRTAHDGGTILGPKWAKYGMTVDGVVEIGNTFAIELGVLVPQRGYVSREENVVVTANGADYLSTPQEAVWVI